MQDRNLSIKGLFVEIAHLHERGEYRQAHQCAVEALEMARENFPGIDLYSRALVLAARSAYYLSLFDEAIFHLDQFIPGENGHDKYYLNVSYRYREPIPSSVVMESAIIRANICRRLGDYQSAIEILKNTEILASSEMSQRLIVERLVTRGSCLYYSGNLESAREDLETALGLSIHNDDTRAKARVLIMLGLISRSMGFMEKALEYFQRGRELCRVTDDSYGEAASYLNESIALYHRGLFIKARKAVLRARSLFGKVEWQLGVCRSLIVEGNIRRKGGDYKGALRNYGRAEQIASDSGFAREKAIILEMYGTIFGLRGDLVQAMKMFSDSLEAASACSPDCDVSASVQRRIGLAYLLDGKISESISVLESVLSSFREKGDKLSEGLALRALGSNRFNSGDRAEGKALFMDALSVLRSSGCSHELARTHLIYASELLDLGNADLIDSVKYINTNEREDFEEALRNLMEAGHLFAGTDDVYYKSRTDLAIDKMIRLRHRPSPRMNVMPSGRPTLSIKHSSQYMISDNFAAVSERMQEVWNKVLFASRFSGPVLVTGETGTGKELIAALIHRQSDRAGRPFVAVNCAAIPDHLFESEFFGHKKGCFTGATSDRRGFFEEANGGTIFLDEIGELTTFQQVKLLRVLQEKKIRRVGDNIERSVDVRVISATNRNLERMIDKSAFREDFFYRINAERVHIDPLRKRPEDIIPILAWRFANDGDRSVDSENKIHIEQEALKCLQSYHWPGNVRELLSVLDRLAHMSDTNTITFDMLPEKIRDKYRTAGMEESAETIEDDNREKMKRKLGKVLDLCKGNKTAAARWLGISRGTLYKELRRAGLEHFIR